MPQVSAKPIRTLHEHTVELEAAITVALANPRKNAVHKLRSQTRRIEAQLLLLDQLRHLPPHRTEETGLRRELKRIRQAAGTVRDIDVQTDYLVHVPDAEGILPYLAKQREKTAAALVKLLTKRQARVSLALEALRKALKPAETLALSVAELLGHAQTLLDRVLLPGIDFTRLSEDHLHDLRKAAKLSRYLCESSPRSKRAAAEGARYEALQDEGGRWHDALALTELLKRRLGREHSVTQRLRTLRERHYKVFVAALQKF